MVIPTNLDNYMGDNSRPNPFFIADHLAIDFLNSVVAPTNTEFEWLDNGADLLAWLVQAKLVPALVVVQFSEQADPHELDAVATQARELREWFRSFIKHNAGKPIQSSLITELDPINHLLAKDNSHRQLELSNLSNPVNKQSSFKFVMQLNRQWRSPGSLLIPLAEVIADLICHADFTQIKNCEGATCTMWFHDISKNHARRWCSMAVCGNRAKAAAHRAKKKSARSKRTN